MNPLNNYTPDIDFFLVNPQFKITFKEVKNSNLMWFLAFVCEEEDNIYSDIPELERIDLLSKEFNIKEKNIDTLIDKYKNIRQSYIQRKLNNWKAKIDERDEFIAKTPYDADSCEMLDKMMSGSDKIYKQYNTIFTEFMKEKATRNIGDKEVSISDKGLI